MSSTARIQRSKQGRQIGASLLPLALKMSPCPTLLLHLLPAPLLLPWEPHPGIHILGCPSPSPASPTGGEGWERGGDPQETAAVVLGSQHNFSIPSVSSGRGPRRLPARRPQRD